MLTQFKSFALTTASLLLALNVAQAQSSEFVLVAPGVPLNVFLGGGTTVYDNLLTSTANGGTSQLNTSNPIFGDSLNMTQGGTLGVFGASLFNSSSGGNTGSILTGNMLVNFYDNTVPYTAGPLGAPLASVSLFWDLTSFGGLAPGQYTTDVFDISSFGIVVPKDILVTQQFTMASGTSLRNGVILFSDPVVGTSPNSVYLQSSTTAEGLYAFSGAAANSQFGYYVEIVPEPTSVCLLGLGLGALLVSRSRNRCAA